MNESWLSDNPNPWISHCRNRYSRSCMHSSFLHATSSYQKTTDCTILLILIYSNRVLLLTQELRLIPHAVLWSTAVMKLGLSQSQRAVEDCSDSTTSSAMADVTNLRQLWDTHIGRPVARPQFGSTVRTMPDKHMGNQDMHPFLFFFSHVSYLG